MAASCLHCSADLPGGDAARCPDCGSDGRVRLEAVERSPLGAQLLQRLRAATSGEFEVVREIGNGGMARVYLARELALERHVALKVLSPLFSDYPEIVRRFQQEARTAAQLSHPHIVPVFAVYQGSGLCFFTMPFVEGPSLRQILNQSEHLELDEALEYLRQAAAALSYAHEHGVVHRDVKPENMLLERSTGRLVLTDFGLAKALGAESLTIPGDMIGTPHYMAPEQCEGRRSVDGRSDQYSLALVAYELLAGGYPFEGEGLRELLVKRLSEDPPPLRRKCPELPEHVSAAIHRALSRDAEQRFPNIDAFMRALTGKASDENLGERTIRSSLLGVPANGGNPARTVTTPTGATLPELSSYSPSGTGRYKLWAVRAVVVAVASVSCYLAISTVSGSKSRAETHSFASSEGLAFVDRSPLARTDAVEIAGPPAPIAGPPAPAEAETSASTIDTRGSDWAGGPDRTATASPRKASDRRLTKGNVGGASAPSKGREAGGRPAIPRSSSRARVRTASDRTAPGAPTEGAGGDDGSTLSSESAGTTAAPVEAEEAAGPTAVPAPNDVLERYRRALQDEDVAAVRALYGTGMPAADVRFLETMFENAEGIQASLDLVDLRVDGETATADVDFPLSYVLSKTKWSQQHTLKLRLGLLRSPDGWRIDHSERR